MKFRRIYWVTEQLDHDGSSQVAGVFTSIPDLLDGGLKWVDSIKRRDGIRLNLIQLDNKEGPLGTWTSPGFQNLAEDLKQFVASGEYSSTECETLVDSLKKHCSE